MGTPAQQLQAFGEVIDALHGPGDAMQSLRRALYPLAVLFQTRHAAIDVLPLDGSPPHIVEILHAEEVAESLDNYRAFVTESPNVSVVRAGGFSPVLRISDHFSRRQFEESGFYRAIFHPAGWKDQLGFAIQLEHAAVGVTFQRGSVFSDEEARVAEMVQRHVAARFARGAERKSRNPFQSAWQLPLSPDSKIVLMPLGVHQLLQRYYGPFDPPSLPPALRIWLKRARDRHGSSPPFATESAQVCRPHGCLELRLLSGATWSSDLLVLDERRGRHDFFRLRNLGLTEREIEVLFWVAQGKADADIAPILGAAKKTVSKHVENLLLKLNSPNRTAAAVKAIQWLNESG
jgi:DNA-binding CsgD family transcriptional regulator